MFPISGIGQHIYYMVTCMSNPCQDNVNSWGQLLSWRALLQARNAKLKGGQSATNLYAYTQYLFGVAIVATIDLDAPDSYLVDPQHAERSNWLLKNTVRVKLPEKETFFEQALLPKASVPNTYSLFAGTVKRRRTQLPAASSAEGLAASFSLGEAQTPQRATLRQAKTTPRRLAPEDEEEEDDPFGFGFGLG